MILRGRAQRKAFPGWLAETQPEMHAFFVEMGKVFGPSKEVEYVGVGEDELRALMIEVDRGERAKRVEELKRLKRELGK